MRIAQYLLAGLLAANMAFPATGAAAIKESTSQPDIEIWLSEGIGRYGDREFEVRGGSKKNPSPTGAFTVEWKARKWWSRQYDAAMPYAMFYYRGAALHQGVMRGHSHGCIRLHEKDAKFLYNIAKEKKTRVFVYP